jgi:predicted MFS family arabinose efflux permease
MPNAIAAHYVSLNVCAMLGPAAAGLLLSVPSVGLPGTYGAIVALLALTVAVFLLLPDHRADASEAGSAWARMREGIRYIRRTPPLPALIGLAGLVMLFGMPYQQLLPVFAERVFAAGADGLGWLVACVGIGAVLGSVVTAPLRSRAGLARYQLVFGLAFGVALVGFGYAPNFGLALVGAAFAGFAASALIVVNNSLVISRSDPRLYGRVWSINQLTFGLGLLGALPMAWLADRIGPSGAVAVGGLLVAAATLAVARYAAAHPGDG